MGERIPNHFILSHHITLPLKSHQFACFTKPRRCTQFFFTRGSCLQCSSKDMDLMLISLLSPQGAKVFVFFTSSSFLGDSRQSSRYTKPRTPIFPPITKHYVPPPIRKPSCKQNQTTDFLVRIGRRKFMRGCLIMKSGDLLIDLLLHEKQETKILNDPKLQCPTNAQLINS